MKDQMYDAMYRTDQFHWWFRAKRKIVMGLLSPYLSNSQKKKIIDFGCGCGMMLEELKPYGEITGTDYSQRALDYCKKRFSGELRQIDLASSIKPWNFYDIGIALDILEHIDKDSTATKNIFNFLYPGGLCIITVPAYQWLWSSHDENCMHKRRYSKKELVSLLVGAGFQIEYISYYDTLLFLPAAFFRLFSKLFHFDRNSSIENHFQDTRFNSILFQIFSLEKNWLCRGKSFPFGLSLIALAKRPV